MEHISIRILNMSLEFLPLVDHGVPKTFVEVKQLEDEHLTFSMLAP